MKGQLIVIEGNNASGKATQARLLVQRIRSEGKKIVGLTFPQYKTEIGKVIGRYLRGEFGDVADISPYVASTLYAFDRLQLKKSLEKWLREGYTIVTDRYVESNKAFQAAKLPEKERKNFFSFIDTIEYKVGGLPKPSKIIFLDVPLIAASQLHEKKPARSYIGKQRDIHERNPAFLQQVEKTYRSLAKKERWKIVQCMRHGKLLPKEKIAEKIYSLL